MNQLSGIGIVLLAACGSGSNQSALAVLTLGSGAVIEANTDRVLSSRTDTAGGTFTASVSRPVKDGDGLVVIPAGSTLHLMFAELQPANDKSAADGELSVTLSAVTVGGKQFPVSGEVTSMAHVLDAVAVETANRDVVVPAGTPITVTLHGPVTISFR